MPVCLFAQTGLQADQTLVAITQDGNIFGSAVIIGTNDAQPLDFKTNGTVWSRVSQAGQFQLTAYSTPTGVTGTTSHFTTFNPAGKFLTKSAAEFLTDLGITGTPWVNGGNALTATGKFGTTTPHGFNFIANNFIRGGMTPTGDFSFGQSGGTARVNAITGGQEAPQLMLKSLGANGDSTFLLTGMSNPNGLVTSRPGSLFLRGTANPELYINNSVGTTGTSWRLFSAPETVEIVRDPVAVSVSVPASGIIADGWYRVPAKFNGYLFSGVTYSVATAGVGAGDLTVRIDRAGTGVHGTPLPFLAGETQKEVFGTGIVVSTNQILKVEVLNNTLVTSPEGFQVTYHFTKI